MKYLHIMNHSNYTVSHYFVKFINDFFCQDEHTFVFVGRYDERYEKLQAKTKIIQINDFKSIIPLMKKAEFVVLHALTFNAQMQLKCIMMPEIMKKIIWVAWGGDLYKSKAKRNIKNVFRLSIKKLFIKRLKGFASIFDPDAEYFKKNYKSNANIALTSYVSGLYADLYKKDFPHCCLQEKYDNGECINIIVGHQANPELNHIRVLTNLLPYKDENIKVYIPLSYGDKSNVAEVEAYAKEKFGDKAVVITEMMNPCEYDKFLEQMHIGIYDTTRQIGLGNISKLLFMRKKIYLTAGSVMYNYYTQNNVYVGNCDNIGKISFSDFIKDFDSESSIEYSKKRITDKEKKIEDWKKVFSLIG